MRRPVSLSLTLLATAALGLSACKRVDAPAAEAAAPQ
ncbi:acid phosphatase, partial [Stenotrophomonas maltophilia]